MPDEFDFKNYKSIEEFSKTLEGTKYLHDIYLKAVNHPVRREILNIVNQAQRISKDNLYQRLFKLELINDEFGLNYNIDYLKKALCINEISEFGDIYYEITQSGKVIEYLE